MYFKLYSECLMYRETYKPLFIVKLAGNLHTNTFIPIDITEYIYEFFLCIT